MNKSFYNKEVLAAHERNDSLALSQYYGEYAKLCLAQDIDQACFYLTHAYVFALEANDPRSREWYELLLNYGREERP